MKDLNKELASIAPLNLTTEPSINSVSTLLLGGSRFADVYLDSWGGDGVEGTYYFRTVKSNGNIVDIAEYGPVPNLYRRESITKANESNELYYISVRACNDEEMCAEKNSKTFYVDPPTPVVTITSCFYNPNTGLCHLRAKWTKGEDAGYYDEIISYKVTDSDGNTYGAGNIAVAANGDYKYGNIELTNVSPSAEITVEVTCTTDGGSSTGVATVQSPMAPAGFTNIEWNETRRSLTVTASAPGAHQVRISAGYSPDVYDIDTNLTSGTTGTLRVSDLKHGNGEILYLQAIPEDEDGTQYPDQASKTSMPIPNPILGVWVPSCKDTESGKEKKYIVDIVEKKKGATDCTERWKTGDRVVIIKPCGAEAPWGNIWYGSTSNSEDWEVYELRSQADFDLLYGSPWDWGGGGPLQFEGLEVEKGNIRRIDVGSNITRVENYFANNFNGIAEVNLGSNVAYIGDNFCEGCWQLTKFGGFPDSLTHIGQYFFNGCSSFNQPFSWPTSPDWDGNLWFFMSSCSSFNQPLEKMPDTTTELHYFMNYCSAYNQPLPEFPDSITALQCFFESNYSFDQPVPNFPANLTTLAGFLGNCHVFNSTIPTTFPSGVITLGSFMSGCDQFDQPIPTVFPPNLTDLSYFLSSGHQFNHPIPTVFPDSVRTVENFLFGAGKFNQPIPTEFPSGIENINRFLAGCMEFNYPVPTVFPDSITQMISYMVGCSSFDQPIPQAFPSKITSLTQWMGDWRSFSHPAPAIPSHITSLAGGFTNLFSFTDSITIPSSVNAVSGSGGSYSYPPGCPPLYFMSTTVQDGNKGYTGPVMWETVPDYGSNTECIMSSTYNTSKTYTQGVAVQGSKASNIRSKYSNRTTAPYRRLV